MTDQAAPVEPIQAVIQRVLKTTGTNAMLAILVGSGSLQQVDAWIDGTDPDSTYDSRIRALDSAISKHLKEHGEPYVREWIIQMATAQAAGVDSFNKTLSVDHSAATAGPADMSL